MHTLLIFFYMCTLLINQTFQYSIRHRIFLVQVPEGQNTLKWFFVPISWYRSHQGILSANRHFKKKKKSLQRPSIREITRLKFKNEKREIFIHTIRQILPLQRIKKRCIDNPKIELAKGFGPCPLVNGASKRKRLILWRGVQE